MERNDYLKLAQAAAYKRSHENKPEWKPDELVRWNSGDYIPHGYRLLFDGDGNATHSAELLDLHAVSVVTARLDQVEVAIKVDDE